MAVAEFFSFEGKDCLGGEKEEGKDEGSQNPGGVFNHDASIHSCL